MDGTVRGYGPWGFLDVWRRKKSLWWDAKLIHSPIWIPVRRVEFARGQRTVQIPIENRYAFTNLNEVRAIWELGAKHGRCRLDLPPQATGAIEVTVFQETRPAVPCSCFDSSMERERSSPRTESHSARRTSRHRRSRQQALQTGRTTETRFQFAERDSISN